MWNAKPTLSASDLSSGIAGGEGRSGCGGGGAQGA